MQAPMLALAATCALLAVATAPAVQRPDAETTLHVYVDVPDAPGTKVTLRYLEGPDSLKGTTTEVMYRPTFSCTASL